MRTDQPLSSRLTLHDQAWRSQEIKRDQTLLATPEEWARHLTQADIPAIFGLDPQLQPMDIKLEKSGLRAPTRCAQAYAALSTVVATVAADPSWANLITLRRYCHHEQPAMSLQGVLAVAPRRGGGRRAVRDIHGVIVPVIVSCRFSEAADLGWQPPAGGYDDTACVPLAARTIGAYALAVSQSRWVRIAAVFADLKVVLYRLRIISDDASRLLSRAAGWWLQNIGGDDQGNAGPASPVDSAEPLLVDQDLLELHREGLALAQQIGELEDRRAQIDRRVLEAIGTSRLVVNQQGTVLMRVVQRPAVVLAESDEIPVDFPVRLVTPPPEVTYERT